MQSKEILEEICELKGRRIKHFSLSKVEGPDFTKVVDQKKINDQLQVFKQDMEKAKKI